jgi:hypothetical protein
MKNPSYRYRYIKTKYLKEWSKNTAFYVLTRNNTLISIYILNQKYQPKKIDDSYRDNITLTISKDNTNKQLCDSCNRDFREI